MTVTIPTAVAPASLSGTPAFRGWLPTGLPNTATTSTEMGENPFGLANADVAKGYITSWTAMAGSASNASLGSASGNGLVIDDLGGLGACGLYTSDTYSGGGIRNSSAYGSNLPSSKNFTLALAVNATANPQSTTSVDDASIQPNVFVMSNDATDTIRVRINERREWVIQTTGPTLGNTENTCTHRATASTQILVVVGSADELTVSVYTRATGTLTNIGTFDPLIAASMGYSTIGIVPNGSVATLGWRGGFRAGVLVNSALTLSEDSQLPGLAEWLLQQAGTGMGDTTETKAVVYVGDSTAAGCFAFGVRTRAGYMAARAHGRAVVDTVGILSATAAWWLDTGTADRVATLCDFSKMFPGHTITRITVIVRLGINDAGISGMSPATAAAFGADLETLEARLIAQGAAAGKTVSVVFNTIEAAANSGGWAIPTLNAQRMDLVDTFNAQIRSRFPAAQISDVGLYGPGAKPAALGTGAWTDSILEKLTKTPSYQIPTTSAAASTRLTWDGIHQGHDGHGEAVAVDMTNPTVLAGLGLGSGGGGGGRRRCRVQMG